jgi:hypothetical protein
LSELPIEEQEELLIDLNKLVFQGSILRLFEKLDATSKQEFLKLLETNPDDATVDEFLRKRVSDPDAVVAETVKEISDDILAVTGTK